MQQELEQGCVEVKEALPGTEGQSLGYRALQRGGGTQSLYSLNPSSMEKGVCVSVPFGRRLFWESPPELLLVLMLCDNNLSCLLLVYAGHEKALCAAQGAGCQLGSVRRSLCAPRLQPPRQNPRRSLGGAHGQELAPHRRGGTAAPAPRHLLPFTPLGGGNTLGSSGKCFYPKKTFPALDAIFLWAV